MADNEIIKSLLRFSLAELSIRLDPLSLKKFLFFGFFVFLNLYANFLEDRALGDACDKSCEMEPAGPLHRGILRIKNQWECASCKAAEDAKRRAGANQVGSTPIAPAVGVPVQPPNSQPIFDEVPQFKQEFPVKAIAEGEGQIKQKADSARTMAKQEVAFADADRQLRGSIAEDREKIDSAYAKVKETSPSSAADFLAQPLYPANPKMQKAYQSLGLDTNQKILDNGEGYVKNLDAAAAAHEQQSAALKAPAKHIKLLRF